MHEHNEILVALVGQPNSGKSTVFNYLTGLHQTIANYPGVTVTKKSGHYHDGHRRIEVVDLPGTYSLTSYSQEERVTRDFLLLERPEVVVAVVDASNLRRHLYFIFQLLELRIPLVICLNMMDTAERRGIELNVQLLEQELGVPIIPTCGRQGKGLDRLKQKINEISALHDHEPAATWKIDYEQLEPILDEIDRTLAEKEFLAKDFSTRWLAIKLLENDREARRIVQHHIHEKDWESIFDCWTDKIDRLSETGDSPRKIIAACRNKKAEQLERDVQRREVVRKRNSDSFDRFLCHPIFGLFFVALVMLLTFNLAFNVSDGWNWFPWFDEDGSFVLTTPVEACDSIFAHWIPLLLDSVLHLPDGSDLHSLVYDGIIAGIGGVLVFVPVIFCIFLFVSILEQTGYMARCVVVLDRIMRFFGLHGQSVLPMILGGGIVGGCAVPAVMATRTMREQRERLLTIMVIPIMNCGAKIPVYALLISAFFLSSKALLMTGIIFLSWAVALLSAKLLGSTLIQGKPTPLIIELPAYQFPGLADIFSTACRQSWWFMKKAGTIILAVNVLLWVLMYYPAPTNPNATDSERLQGSYAAQLGHLFVPVSQWAGFDWKDNIALIGGFAAKEVIVTSLATVYGIEADDSDEPATTEKEATEIESEHLDEQGKRLVFQLRSAGNWTPLKAFAMMIFVMIYAPCIPTCIVIWQETGAFKYMAMAMCYNTIVATILAISVYQLGNILLPLAT